MTKFIFSNRREWTDVSCMIVFSIITPKSITPCLTILFCDHISRILFCNCIKYMTLLDFLINPLQASRIEEIILIKKSNHSRINLEMIIRFLWLLNTLPFITFLITTIHELFPIPIRICRFLHRTVWMRIPVSESVSRGLRDHFLPQSMISLGTPLNLLYLFSSLRICIHPSIFISLDLLLTLNFLQNITFSL